VELRLSYWQRSKSLVLKLTRPWTWFRQPQVASQQPAVLAPAIPTPTPEPEPERDFNGTGSEVLLQGFHWESCRGSMHTGTRKSWYRILSENAHVIKSAAFDGVWFPPPSDSLSPQGYMPRQWYHFDTYYGNANELKKAISDLKPVHSIADVVLNHRVGMRTAGADFENPSFRDNARAVVGNDQSGCGRGNPDSGSTFAAARDLDHCNPDVQQAVAEYLLRLKNDFGFSGWRYDMALGFAPRFVGQYNRHTRPQFSIGEHWSGQETVARWIDESKAHDRAGRSMAFDFETRAHLYTAIVEDKYEILKTLDGKPGGLIGRWPGHAVTFVDNHDTEWRRRGENGVVHFENQQVGQAYAYVLTHPGVPCVFWSHFFELGTEIQNTIKNLIVLRRSRKINSRSTVHIAEARQGLYAALIGEVSNGSFSPQIAMKLGSAEWNPGQRWHIAGFGNRFAVWTQR
jgi:alpha-amylase